MRELGGVNATLPQHISIDDFDFDSDFFSYKWTVEERRDFLKEEEEILSQLHLDEKKKGKLNENKNSVGGSGNIVGISKGMFYEFMKKQMEIQMQWVKDNENWEEWRRKKRWNGEGKWRPWKREDYYGKAMERKRRKMKDEMTKKRLENRCSH